VIKPSTAAKASLLYVNIFVSLVDGLDIPLHRKDVIARRSLARLRPSSQCAEKVLRPEVWLAAQWRPSWTIEPIETQQKPLIKAKGAALMTMTFAIGRSCF
jgi:hypothetical protein